MKLMRATALLAFVLSRLAAGAAAVTDSPAAKLEALGNEYNAVSAGMRDAKTDLERKAVVEGLRNFPARYLEWAEKHRDDPVALKAMRSAIQAIGTTDSLAQVTWETNVANFPAGSPAEVAGEAVRLLKRDHLKSSKLSPVCDRMRYGYRLEFAEFLEQVVRENPHHEVRATACWSLAFSLSDRLKMLRLADDRPELRKCYRLVFGENYLPELERMREAGLERKVESLLERVRDEFGDVKHRDSTFAEVAKRELYSMRTLAVGKPAPDSTGVDEDGKQFKLSNYRGKVVLLYFWMEF